MDRKAARALAKTTLAAVSGIGSATEYEPDVFSGSAFAVIHSKSLAVLQSDRDGYASPAEIWVTIYVLRTSTTGATVENTLDDLTRASMRALWTAFEDAANNLQIGPSEAGIPLKTPDGKAYRMERFAVRFDDDA